MDDDRLPAVLLLAFNRPEQTRRMLGRLRPLGLRRLHVACDGPRAGRAEDAAGVSAIRAMVDAVDWCEVRALYRAENLGCGRAVSGAITWFLDEVGEGVILEDDCLPDPTFLPFAGQMLARYRDRTNVMQVAGYNFLSGEYEPATDYIFSHFGWQWGWATWKRAWDLYDFEMSRWPEFKRMGYARHFPCYPDGVDTFNRTYVNQNKAWAYQWHVTMITNSGLSVVPKYSLIENIGFGANATHGKDAAASKTFGVNVRPVSFPVTHCPFVFADPLYDQKIVRKVEDLRSLKGRARLLLKRLNGTLYR